jgi:RHS repeat-associated protein
VYYYFVDAIGNTRAVTNATGTPCFDADYYPYGQENDYITSCSPTYKFTGYESDSETGNYYAYARYYNPRLGRFMSPDPFGGDILNPQTLNRYTYVLNNPASLIDPLGLCPTGTVPVVWGDGQTYCQPGSGLGGGNGEPGGCTSFTAPASGDCPSPTYGPGGLIGPLPTQTPQTQTPQCTALQRDAGLIADQLKSNAESLGLLTLGGGLVSAILTAGEEGTAGLDTPLTLTAYHATQIFAALGILELGASAAFESYASGGSLAALKNFAWDQFATLVGGAAAELSGVPILSRFAEPLGDLAGRAASLANQAEVACR